MRLLTIFNKNFIILLVIIGIFTSRCSDGDKGIQVLSPELQYNETEKTVSFMGSGEFETPIIERNGEEGSLQSINTSLEGIYIDQTTGTISYDGPMPLGTVEVLISAQKSTGESTNSLVLEHLFDADMAGVWNLYPNDETNFPNDKNFDFYVDGTFENTPFFITITEINEGTWIRKVDIFTLEELMGSHTKVYLHTMAQILL